MKKSERELFRAALMSGIKPPDELQERFDKQIEALVRRKLSAAEKICSVFLAVVFIAMSVIFACICYSVTTVEDSGLTPSTRVFMFCGFGAGAIGFLAGAIYAIRGLLAGRMAPRGQQQGMIALVAGCVLLYCVSALTFAPRDLPAEKLIWMNTGLLFFWIMTVGYVLMSKSQWQHEDTLLEQKRTQLEIALLRQELRQNSGLLHPNNRQDIHEESAGTK